MKRLGWAVVLSLAALLSACAGPGASAPSGSQAQAGGWMDACKADIANYCSNVQGRKQIRQCLTQNQSSLSADCQQALASAHHGHGG